MDEKPLNLRRLIFLCLVMAAGITVVLLVIPGSLRKLLIAAVIAIPLFLGLFSKPRILFYILIFCLFSEVYWYFGFAYFQILYVLAFASWVVWALERRRLVVHDPVFVSLAAAFFILLFLSLIAARDIDSSIHRLKQIVLLMAYILLTMQFVGDRREFRIFLLVVASAVVASNFLPMIIPPPQVYDAPSIITAQGVIRFEGLLFEPNVLALLQIFAIPIFVFFVLMYRKPFIVRPVALLSIIGSIVIVVISFSRGGFLSLAFLLLVLLYLERRNKLLLGFGLAFIVAGLLMVPPSYYIRIGSIFNALSEAGDDYPVYTRLQTMKSAIQLGIRNPIFGIGLENFKARTIVFTSMNLTVHNALLQIFAELGIAAFGFFIAIIVYNIRLIRDMMRQADAETAKLGTILMLQQVSVLFNALFIPVAYYAVLWFTLALPSIAHSAYRPAPPPSGRK